MSVPTAYVHVELAGVTRLVGILFASTARGRQSATFEYASDWLRAPD